MENSSRDFLENWVTLNLYCNTNCSDEILLNINNKIKKESTINNWFYLRYNHPHNHLKIRLKYEIQANLKDIKNIYESSLTQNLIWRIQVDTYFPEEYRYRLFDIKISENLFCHYSDLSIYIINNAKGELQKLFSCFIVIKRLLSGFFDYNNELILNYLFQFEEHFNNNYFYNTKLKKRLSKKYIEIKDTKLSNVIIKEIKFKIDKGNQIVPLNGLKGISKNRSELFDFINGHIHLIVNRTMNDFQKIYEAIIYKFLIKEFKNKKIN